MSQSAPLLMPSGWSGSSTGMRVASSAVKVADRQRSRMCRTTGSNRSMTRPTEDASVLAASGTPSARAFRSMRSQGHGVVDSDRRAPARAARCRGCRGRATSSPLSARSRCTGGTRGSSTSRPASATTTNCEGSDVELLGRRLDADACQLDVAVGAAALSAAATSRTSGTRGRCAGSWGGRAPWASSRRASWASCPPAARASRRSSAGGTNRAAAPSAGDASPRWAGACATCSRASSSAPR